MMMLLIQLLILMLHMIHRFGLQKMDLLFEFIPAVPGIIIAMQVVREQLVHQLFMRTLVLILQLVTEHTMEEFMALKKKTNKAI